MPFEDTYRTIKSTSTGTFKDRGSKFFAYAFPVISEEEVKKKLLEIRKKHHDARHHCYAYQLGSDKSAYRINDDGEPSGTAGRPIFGQIRSKDLTNVIIIVVRYFGGTKLGVSGLINAYKTAAIEALDNVMIQTKTINDVYELEFGYETMNAVMKISKDNNAELLSQEFDMACKITISVRKTVSSIIYDKLSLLKGLSIKYQYTY